MTALIDNGHGRDCPGKRSPDGVFREWSWCRDVAEIVVESLKASGIRALQIVPEENDVLLGERCRRANAYAKTDKDTILVSIHVNAAGDGKTWNMAQGWQVHTYLNPSSASVKLAECLFDEAYKRSFYCRKPGPLKKYWPKNLMILRETSCPAVLVENMFMDNREDLQYLLSPNSIYECAAVIVEGVKRYFGK